MAEIENLKIGNGTIHIVGNQDIVADSWEAGKTYVADRSYVIREHILYVCNTTHTSVEPFDPTKWTATTIGEALGMAGSANVIECTLAEYTAWKAGGLLINETTYVLTDAPNLNATSEDLSYDGGATSTHDVISSIFKVDSFTKPYSISANGTANFDNSFITVPTGYKIGALLGYSSGDNRCYFSNCRPSDTGSYAFYVQNTSSSALSNTASVFVLFVREDCIAT